MYNLSDIFNKKKHLILEIRTKVMYLKINNLTLFVVAESNTNKL